MMKFPVLIIALSTLLQAMPSDTCNQNTWVTNGPVYAIAPAGGKVYIGGSFSRVGPYTDGVLDSIHSVVRNNIAALDATTGNALAWNPNAHGKVWSLAVSGTTVYAGGDFDSIGGQSRNRIAALDATTGSVLTWNPNANGRVLSLAASGTTVYAGGDFDSIGGQSRNYIAALDMTTGNALAWNPNAHVPKGGDPMAPVYGDVISLALNGTTVYAGGDFDSIGGQSRNYIAALDMTTGDALAWNPNANSGVYSLAVSGTTVYAVGEFTSIGGQNRHNHIAALDATTGNATIWNPYSGGNFFNEVGCLAVSRTTVYAGGNFYSYGSQDPKVIAAFDVTIGNLLAWSPNANLNVYSLATSGSSVYVGGIFTSIGQGIGHPFFAQFDSSRNSPVIQPISSTSLNIPALHIITPSSRSSAFIKFTYALPASVPVSLRLYTLNGQLQAELVNKHQDAGNYSFSLQKGKLATGAYLVSFKAGDFHQEKMISLMK